ncbi:MAG: peptide chain release factor 1 [Candidatus Caldipriscus sp.]|nr:peptide chain release factor 1 [Candidatus Caldipriscus sp.]
MKDRYLEILEKFKALEEKLSQITDFSSEEFRETLEEYKSLKDKVQLIMELQRVEEDISALEELLKESPDPELEIELENLREKAEKLDEEIMMSLVPRDPRDVGNAIIEIRAGVGGEEAALFAKDLARMYIRFAERKGWKVSIIDFTESDMGGYKEVVLLIEGKGAYGLLKFEAGVHRVQRVPITESSGRIHTSAASVVVLPEYEDVKIEVRPEDLKIETFRAGGAGGQHVNKTESAVRITHIPTGIVVTCQDERSQHQNREKAMRILMARLRDYYEMQREGEIKSLRRIYIGSGDRSEKIRTYNFPQNRVTDHRINFTVYNLENVLDGELDEIINALISADLKARLEKS